MKKVVSYLLVCTLLFTLTVGWVSADKASTKDTSLKDETNILEGLSTNEPEETQTNKTVETGTSESIDTQSNEPPEIIMKSTSIPVNTWNISTLGQYDFSGTSHVLNLYTNYLLYGKSGYTVYVKNWSDYDLTVKVKTLFYTYSTQKIPAGGYKKYDVTGMKTTTKFYIQFSGNEMDFSGYIK